MTKYRPRTIAIHAGEEVDVATRASSPHLVMSNSFTLSQPSGFSISSFEADRPYIYTRWDNPTIRMLEEKLAALENAEDCVAFASGMAATAAVLNSVLHDGDHILTCDVHYPGSAELIRSLKARNGVVSTTVDMGDLSMVRDSIQPHTKLIWLETPANPILKISDIRAIADLANPHDILVAVDSTLATPIATQPLDLGADFVIHSLSKYIGGHGDSIGGAVLGSRRNLTKVRDEERVHIGGSISPFNAWLIARGAATLPLRMKQHSENALQLAEFLQAHDRVTHVLYPGLPDHPGHDVAKKQMNCFSGVLSFRVENGRELASRFARELHLIHYAVSLGSHRSLIYWIDTEELLSTAFLLDEQQATQYKSAAGEGVFRFAVGLEDPEDLCEELSAHLD